MTWDINTYNALLVFSLLNLIDIITTFNFIKEHGVNAEANPLARLMFKRLGLVGMFVFKLTYMSGILIILFFLFDEFTTSIWVYNIVESMIIAWNSYMNSRLKKTG
jgi:hypothetical protein